MYSAGTHARHVWTGYAADCAPVQPFLRQVFLSKLAQIEESIPLKSAKNRYFLMSSSTSCSHSRATTISLYWWEPKPHFSLHGLKRIAMARNPLVRNFGDLLSPFIVSRLAGLDVVHAQIESQGKLLAVGSVLHAAKDNDTIWGSGFLNSDCTQAVTRSMGLHFSSVRGPKTWEILRKNGIVCPEIFGDPAVLLPLLVRNDIKPKGYIGFVPHFSHYPDFRHLGKKSKLRIIDVENPPAEVMRNILECDAIYSSSLHGIIVAEAYGIPAQMVVYKKPLHGDIFKFEDYYGSTGRKPKFVQANKPSDIFSIIQKDPLPPPIIHTMDLLKSFPYEVRNPLPEASRPGWSSL